MPDSNDDRPKMTFDMIVFLIICALGIGYGIYQVITAIMTSWH